jgi:capsule biosynthesis phosphatase
MNILIPVGGIGKRFQDEGFELPKPLINVLGKPMISRVISGLEITENDEIYIIYHNFLKDFNFEHVVKSYFPKKNIKFHCLNKVTKGASETVLDCLNEFSQEQLNNRFLILDCDTFHEDNVVSLYKENKYGNLIFYFLDEDTKPIFSYIELDENNRVINIKEKIKISNFANVGSYGFENGNILKKYCQEIMDSEGELYISKIYERMIDDGIEIYSQKISNFNCVGTPLQLKVYCSQNQDKTEKLRFCFDLDNTLVTYPKIHGDYSTVEPIWRNINYVKFLKKLGHTIIVYTARRMRTHNGNIGALVSDIGKVTIETLEKYQIPHDEIVFGKPYANFYVDDLAVNANAQIDKFVGIYNAYDTPRYFNKVYFYDSLVEKHTNNLGEIYWYKNIPDEISDLFPKLINSDDEKFVIEKINGVNFSYLYVNKLLTTDHLEFLLNDLRRIHHSKLKDLKNNIYLNYSEKLKLRFSNSLNLYKKYNLIPIFENIMTKLNEYEKNNLGKPSVIHGDPVFSNIILTENNKIKFIDMRGKLGENLTVYGDLYYDYSKLYQSLIGYDFILKNLEVDNHYIEKFLDFFHFKFNQFELSWIKVITASLFFSLLPLHEEDEIKFKKYIELINNLLKV